MWNGTGYYIPAHYTSAYLHTYLLYDQSCIQFFDTGRGVQRGERKERNFKSVCVSCVRPSVRVSACFPSLSRVVFSSSRLLVFLWLLWLPWCGVTTIEEVTNLSSKERGWFIWFCVPTYLPAWTVCMYMPEARGGMDAIFFLFRICIMPAPVLWRLCAEGERSFTTWWT